MKYILFIFIGFISFNLSAQNQDSHFDGRIKIGNNAALAEEGMIRYNAQTGIFEGYSWQQWRPLTNSCICPYIIAPFNDEGHFGNYSLNNNKIQMTIEFSHRMNPASFVYGTNVLVSGTAESSSGGTLTWRNNNTILVIETNEYWTGLAESCFDGWDLQILGTGLNGVQGINGTDLDGDRDGCCGGDYSIHFSILC